MKYFYLLLSLAIFPLLSHSDDTIISLEDSPTLACELLFDTGTIEDNDQKYLECFNEFIKIFPTDEYADPALFLADALSFMKQIYQNNTSTCAGFFHVGSELQLAQIEGIHIGLQLEAGSDIPEQHRWNIMLAAVAQLINEYRDNEDATPLLQGLIKVIPPAIVKPNEQDRFSDDSCGNRFKFDFNLC